MLAKIDNVIRAINGRADHWEADKLPIKLNLRQLERARREFVRRRIRHKFEVGAIRMSKIDLRLINAIVRADHGAIQ